jgi:hypothetical protein
MGMKTAWTGRTEKVGEVFLSSASTPEAVRARITEREVALIVEERDERERGLGKWELEPRAFSTATFSR